MCRFVVSYSFMCAFDRYFSDVSNQIHALSFNVMIYFSHLCAQRGQTASERAEENGNGDIVELIELHGTPAGAVAELGRKVSLPACQCPDMRFV